MDIIKETVENLKAHLVLDKRYANLSDYTYKRVTMDRVAKMLISSDTSWGEKFRCHVTQYCYQEYDVKRMPLEPNESVLVPERKQNQYDCLALLNGKILVDFEMENWCRPEQFLYRVDRYCSTVIEHASMIGSKEYDIIAPHVISLYRGGNLFGKWGVNKPFIRSDKEDKLYGLVKYPGKAKLAFIQPKLKTNFEIHCLFDVLMLYLNGNIDIFDEHCMYANELGWFKEAIMAYLKSTRSINDCLWDLREEFDRQDRERQRIKKEKQDRWRAEQDLKRAKEERQFAQDKAQFLNERQTFISALLSEGRSPEEVSRLLKIPICDVERLTLQIR